MNVTIAPSALQGTVRAIPSKSQAHRLLLCAALAHWISLWAFVANMALLLACCASEMHIDWEKAFEKYKIGNQPKGF